MFRSKKATSNYYDEMTSEHFEEWLHDSSMPNIQCTYHVNLNCN